MSQIIRIDPPDRLPEKDVEPECQVGCLKDHESVPDPALVQEGDGSECDAEHGLGRQIHDPRQMERDADDVGMEEMPSADAVRPEAVDDGQHVEQVEEASARVEDDHTDQGEEPAKTLPSPLLQNNPVLKPEEADDNDESDEHEHDEDELSGSSASGFLALDDVGSE